MHILIVGSTGKGKSTVLRHMTGTDQVLCLDMQPYSTAWDLIAANGGILDDLDDTKNCLPFQTWKTNRERESILESLIRRRGVANADANPQLETVTLNFLKVCQPDWHIKESLRFFRRGNEYEEMLARCDDRDVVSWWRSQPKGAQWERITSPTERLCSILGRDQIAGRIQNSTRYRDALEAGENIGVTGGDACSESEIRMLLGWRLREAMRWKRETRNDRPLTVVIEEADASGLVDRQSVTDLLTQRKNNVRFTIISQTGFFIDEATTNAVWNNTSQVILGCNSAEVARRAANGMTNMYSPKAVKQWRERLIQLGDQQFVETTPDYWKPEEQFKQIQQWVMRLERGEAFTIHDGHVRFIRFPALPKPESIGEQSWLVPLKKEENEKKGSEISSTSTQPPLSSLFD